MFPAIDKNVTFPDRELEILKLWQEQEIYHKTLRARAEAPPFVFYEGPPTANGMPHPGHCLTRAIKDLFPRYKTMRGYLCERKAGWDTHGLPVEVEVCKELGIHSKEDIENFKSTEEGLPDGIEGFIQLCQQSVWRYMSEWERLTERLGFWVDLENAYVTYHQSYVESVWWSLKNLFDRGLLYRGHKIVWWWAQGGTALSSGEVGQGYRQVADPSVYVELQLRDKKNERLVVWTTTPWTLPSNTYVAVNPRIVYAAVHFKGHKDSVDPTLLIVAEDLVEEIAQKLATTRKINHQEYEIKKRYQGHELVGLEYSPPLPWYSRRESGPIYSGMNGSLKSGGNESLFWRVVEGEFVSTDTGTGLVHIAPAFGEDDYGVLIKEQDRFKEGEQPFLLNHVNPNGTFNEVSDERFRGRFAKDVDKDIIEFLKSLKSLLIREQYLHDYPFCWRAEEDPLIQYPRESWFIRTTEFKDRMLENNSQINWLPEHIKDGRFGKFLESNVDWALSRERYWGTPLPIWVCSVTGKMEAVGSYEELVAKPQAAGFEVWEAAKKANPELPDDLRIHKPYIDAVTYASPFAEGAIMQRVPEVIDCWYDSGAMPFAQWGYRGEPEASAPGVAQKFHSQFPADFISEAIDQTRGWFYSQLAISTLMFGDDSAFPHPFKNCIVLGLMLGEDGQKMSKSKRNYREPQEIFDRYGADALRWYFFANQPPWTSIRYSEEAIKDSVPEFLLRLWNVYSFFSIYANIDEFSPEEESQVLDARGNWTLKRPVQGELDRWILSELHSTCAKVVERMDAYDNFGACQAITAFVDGLSNWYVRRSRDRFWAKEKRSTDKLDAYWTLYECLVTISKVIAPFVPFLAEKLWQDLVVEVFPSSPRGPSPNPSPADRGGGRVVPESVHLCDFPEGEVAKVDAALSEQMELVRLISSLGRQARSAAELKVRQPLAKVEVILADVTHRGWLEEHAEVVADELNVKAVGFTDEPEKYVDHEVLPNFKLLGPKLGKLMPKVKGALSQQSGSQLLANLRDNGRIDLTIDGQEVALTSEEIEIRIQAKPGWTSANDKGVVVVLATEITEELLAEGLARDLVRAIQEMRKAVNCQYTDRIRLAIETESEAVRRAVEQFGDFIQRETLADELKLGTFDGKGVSSTVKIGDEEVTIHLITEIDS